MRWILLFEDTPVMRDVRLKYEGEHLEYLRVHQKEILLAGGLRSDPQSAFTGGLWVLEVTGPDRAVELAEGDPYYVHSTRPYRLLQWGKALTDIRVTL